MNIRKCSITVFASALLALGLIASASAMEAMPAQYQVHVNITKIDGAKKTQVFDQTIPTVSGEAAPFSVVKDTTYVASCSRALGRQTLEPSQVETGVKGSVKPLAQPDGKILLDFTLAVSKLDSMETFTSPDGSCAIQQPSVTGHDFHDAAVVALDAPLTLKAGDKVLTITVSKQ